MRSTASACIAAPIRMSRAGELSQVSWHLSEQMPIFRVTSIIHLLCIRLTYNRAAYSNQQFKISRSHSCFIVSCLIYCLHSDKVTLVAATNRLQDIGLILFQYSTTPSQLKSTWRLKYFSVVYVNQDFSNLSYSYFNHRSCMFAPLSKANLSAVAWLGCSERHADSLFRQVGSAMSS